MTAQDPTLPLEYFRSILHMENWWRPCLCQKKVKGRARASSHSHAAAALPTAAILTAQAASSASHGDSNCPEGNPICQLPSLHPFLRRRSGSQLPRFKIIPKGASRYDVHKIFGSFDPPSPLSAFESALCYKILTTSLTTSAFLLPPPPSDGGLHIWKLPVKAQRTHFCEVLLRPLRFLTSETDSFRKRLWAVKN